MSNRKEQPYSLHIMISNFLKHNVFLNEQSRWYALSVDFLIITEKRYNFFFFLSVAK